MSTLIERDKRSLAAQKGWARRRHQWEKYLNLHGHADCFFAFMAIAFDLRQEPSEFWRLLSETWTRVEMPAQHETLWRQLWDSPVPGREAAMSAEEQATLASLPDPVRVYRGVAHRERIAGLSWTVDRDRAVMFAYRSCHPDYAVHRARVAPSDDCHPLLVTGEVGRSDVLAYIDARQEREVIARSVQVIDVQELDGR